MLPASILVHQDFWNSGCDRARALEGQPLCNAFGYRWACDGSGSGNVLRASPWEVVSFLQQHPASHRPAALTPFCSACCQHWLQRYDRLLSQVRKEKKKGNDIPSMLTSKTARRWLQIWAQQRFTDRPGIKAVKKESEKEGFSLIAWQQSCRVTLWPVEDGRVPKAWSPHPAAGRQGDTSPRQMLSAWLHQQAGCSSEVQAHCNRRTSWILCTLALLHPTSSKIGKR